MRFFYNYVITICITKKRHESYYLPDVSFVNHQFITNNQSQTYLYSIESSAQFNNFLSLEDE